jgi:hypothetical protein
MARLVFLFAALVAGSALAQDLTGKWSSNDGGTYYMRQVGNELWWYGESSDGGRNWTNVLHATMLGDRATGRWSDVPHGNIHSAGEIDLHVVSENKLVATRRTGGFGGSEWTRQGIAVPPPLGAIELLTIPNDKPVKVTSTHVLERGKWYVLEASGVVSDWSDHKDGVDPVWCYAEWRCGKTGEAWQQLRIDDRGLADIHGSAIPYNPQHVYRVRIQGQGRPIVAYASDAQNSAGDNCCSFTLRIYAEGAGSIAETGRSYTSQPRASEAQAQPTGNRLQDALKKGMQDAVKGMLK